MYKMRSEVLRGILPMVLNRYSYLASFHKNISMVFEEIVSFLFMVFPVFAVIRSGNN